jgi:hypothetical protein
LCRSCNASKTAKQSKKVYTNKFIWYYKFA